MNQKIFGITFGAQIGSVNAAEAVQPHLIALRGLLKKYCREPYSPEIDEFAPVARIDGDIDYWEFEGCERMRINRKGRYITIDVGMPRNRWVNVSGVEIRQYLMVHLKEAIKFMVGKLKKEKIAVDDEKLFKELKLVESHFLNI